MDVRGYDGKKKDGVNVLWIEWYGEMKEMGSFGNFMRWGKGLRIWCIWLW